MTFPTSLSTLGRMALLLALGLPGFAGKKATLDIKNISGTIWTTDFDFPANKEKLETTMESKTEPVPKNGEVNIKGKTTCKVTFDRTQASVQGGSIHFRVRNKTTTPKNKEGDHGFTLDESGKLIDDNPNKDGELFTIFPAEAGGNKATTLQIGLDDWPK
jgi:hypothetical protein